MMDRLATCSPLQHEMGSRRNHSGKSTAAPQQHALLGMQRAAGNQAVLQLLAQRETQTQSMRVAATSLSRSLGPPVAQRCGGEVHAGCECAKTAGAKTDDSKDTDPTAVQLAVAETETPSGGPLPLTSPRFAGDAVLEACHQNRSRLAQGAKGAPVAKVQQALVDLGFDVGPKGADADYGPKTAAAVRAFKARERLGSEQFGDVGPGTMGKLDELLPGELPQCDEDDLLVLDDQEDDATAKRGPAEVGSDASRLGVGFKIPGISCQLNGGRGKGLDVSPELKSGSLSFRELEQWHFSGDNPPTLGSVWDVDTKFTVGASLRLDLPLNGDDWDIGIVQNVFFSRSDVVYNFGPVRYELSGPALDIAQGERGPFLHEGRSGDINPVTHVTRTAPAIDPKAFPGFTDRPHQPIRGTSKVGAPSGTLTSIPQSSAITTLFTAFIVARSQTGLLRIIATPASPHSISFRMSVSSFSDPATLISQNGLPGSINLVAIPRQNQVADADLFRTSGQLAVDRENLERQKAFAAAGAKLP